jgi:hypothetical protein
MELRSVEAVAGALNAAGVRYLVVGGLAVNAHGYLRTTVDLDLVVQLHPENVVRGLNALEGIGYKPRIPVTAEQFADQSLRDSWREEKGILPVDQRGSCAGNPDSYRRLGGAVRHETRGEPTEGPRRHGRPAKNRFL